MREQLEVSPPRRAGSGAAGRRRRARWIAWLLAGLTWLWTVEAAAAETREVAVVDEVGRPVAVIVDIEGRGATQVIDPACEAEVGNARRECVAASEPEFRLLVDAGRRGADLYGRVRFDAARGVIELDAHPQAQSRCFETSLLEHGTNLTPAYFEPRAPDREVERSLCGAASTTYVVDSREKRVELDIVDDGTPREFEIVATGASLAGQVQVELSAISFTLRFERAPMPDERVELELRSPGHHPIFVPAPRDEIMQASDAWRRQVARPVAIFEPLRLEVPRDGRAVRPPPDRLTACIKYPKPPANYLEREVDEALADQLAITEESYAEAKPEPESEPESADAGPADDADDACEGITDKRELRDCKRSFEKIQSLRQKKSSARGGSYRSHQQPSDAGVSEDAGASDDDGGVCQVKTCMSGDTQLCQPCLRITEANGALRTSCPMWREAGENRLVLYERDDATPDVPLYTDMPECTPDDGSCVFSRYFADPTAEVIELQFRRRTLDRLELGHRATLAVERILPSGAVETELIAIQGYRGSPRWQRDGATGTVELDASRFADDADQVRYNLHIYSDYSNYPRERAALVLATEIDRAALMTLTHDARALDFPRFGISARIYSGVSLTIPNDAVSERSGDSYSLGADPFLAAALVPEFYITRFGIPLQLVFGVEAEPVREWSIPEVGTPTSTPRWRSRILMGLGVRTRPLPWLLRSAFEAQVAWSPEIPGRGQQLDPPAQLAIMMVALHISYDLLPRYSDRLRMFTGVDTLIGSRTRFEFETADPAFTTTRIHFSLGIAMSF